jgi:hypothetical protein
MADYYWAGSGTYPISIMTNNWQNASGTPYASYMASTDNIYISKPGLGGTSARTFYWNLAMTDAVRQCAAIYHTDAYNVTHLFNSTGSNFYRFGTISNNNTGSNSVTFGVTGTSTASTQLNVYMVDDGAGTRTGTISANDPIIFLAPVTTGPASTNSPARIQVSGTSRVEFRNIVGDPVSGVNTTKLIIAVGGTANLYAANSYSGGTQINGTAYVFNAGAFGLATGANNFVDISGGSTIYFGAGMTTLNNYKYRQNGSYTIDNNNTDVIDCDLGAGAYSITADSTISINRANSKYTISGVITASTFQIKKNGAGTLIVDGLPASFSGLTISNGIFRAAVPTFFANCTGSITVSGTSSAYGVFSNGISSAQVQNTSRAVIVSGDTAGFESHSTSAANVRMTFTSLSGPAALSSSPFNISYNATLGSGGSGVGTFSHTGSVYFNQPLSISVSSNMTVTYSSSLRVVTSFSMSGAGTLILPFTNNNEVYTISLSGKAVIRDDRTLGPLFTNRTLAVILNQGGELQLSLDHGSPHTVVIDSKRYISISSSTTSANPCKIFSDHVALTIPDIASSSTGGFLEVYGSGSGHVHFSGINSTYDGTVKVSGKFYMNVEKGMPNASFVTNAGAKFHVRNTEPTNNYVLYCKTLTLSGGQITMM